MKAKVVIENHETKIVLTSKNEFEEDIIEKTIGQSYSKDIQVLSDYKFHQHSNHRIEINLTRESKKTNSTRETRKIKLSDLI